MEDVECYSTVCLIYKENVLQMYKETGK